MKNSINISALILALAILAMPGVAGAVTLLEIYQQALQSDPLIHEAEARRLASLEAKPQARGAYLPQVSATSDYSVTNRSGPVSFFTESGRVTLDAEIETAHVVGASMGGAISQIVAVKYPERTRSLTLACTAGRNHPWREELLASWRDAALSIHGVIGVPVKFVGVGEKVEDLTPFDPKRMAGRILQMGDIVGLVEKAQQTIDAETSERLEKKVLGGQEFDLEDFLQAMQQIQKMGPLEGLLKMIPGVKPKISWAAPG